MSQIQVSRPRETQSSDMKSEIVLCVEPAILAPQVLSTVLVGGTPHFSTLCNLWSRNIAILPCEQCLSPTYGKLNLSMHFKAKFTRSNKPPPLSCISSAGSTHKNIIKKAVQHIAFFDYKMKVKLFGWCTIVVLLVLVEACCFKKQSQSFSEGFWYDCVAIQGYNFPREYIATQGKFWNRYKWSVYSFSFLNFVPFSIIRQLLTSQIFAEICEGNFEFVLSPEYFVCMLFSFIL